MSGGKRGKGAGKAALGLRDAAVGVLFGLAFLVPGAGVTIWGGLLLRKGRASVEWPTVRGTVVSSRVKRRRSSSSGRSSYHAEVRYRYSVGERAYTGDRVSYGEYGGPGGHAGGVVARYPAGREVDVHCNPSDPSEAVLETGASWPPYAIILIGIVFACVGGFMIYATLRKEPHGRSRGRGT